MCRVENMVAKLIINETNPIAANITCLIDNALGILRLLDTLCCGRNDGIVIVSVIVVDTELSSQCPPYVHHPLRLY